MIFELDDTSKVKHIFESWNETLIYSCIQKVMREEPEFEEAEVVASSFSEFIDKVIRE